MSCTINAKNISYKNDLKTIFENVSFDLSCKEKIAIVGANGSGKSTLLKVLAGLITPSSGEILLFHNIVKDKKEFQSYRSKIGYLPQDVSTFFLSITVIEDVMFSLRVEGFKKDEAYLKAKNMLEKLNILHLENRVIFELSGGEQKIVALASILVKNPDILLLDEPTNALDENSEKIVLNILKNLEISMIIVSHHKNFINDLATKIYTLKDKKLTLN